MGHEDTISAGRDSLKREAPVFSATGELYQGRVRLQDGDEGKGTVFIESSIPYPAFDAGWFPGGAGVLAITAEAA